MGSKELSLYNQRQPLTGCRFFVPSELRTPNFAPSHLTWPVGSADRACPA